MKRRYIEVHLRTSIDAGELLGLLDEGASLGACEKDGGISLYFPLESWDDGMRASLEDALGRLGETGAAGTLTVTELPDQDWNASWTRSLQPIYLGRRILVRQSWNSAPVPLGGFELVIDPKRAFGTGYHATTRLLAEWLESLVGGGERVLDAGTGSGILAMAALRLGARSALGIDNDPEAIECAKEYAALNGLGAELELRVASLEDLAPEPFDLVLANLDRRILTPYFPALHAYLRPEGRLLVSGLLIEEKDEICALLASAGWSIKEQHERDEWMALELIDVR